MRRIRCLCGTHFPIYEIRGKTVAFFTSHKVFVGIQWETHMQKRVATYINASYYYYYYC